LRITLIAPARDPLFISSNCLNNLKLYFMAKDKENGQQNQLAEKEVPAQASLDLSCSQLARYGGFSILETTIDGLQNLHPEKKARKRIFLTDDSKKADREALKKRLRLLSDLLHEGENVPDLIEKATQKADAALSLLTLNLGKTYEVVRDLERSYRSVANFFKNAAVDKIRNLSVMNADQEQITNLENTTFIDEIAEELDKNYDRLDLRENYSLLVLPGYLGSRKVVDKWARIANKNKVMLITDFEHLDAPDDVIDLFDGAQMTGGDGHLSNVMMTCNWLVGRGKHPEEQGEDLYVPPSTALAGRVYSTLMSQVAAGPKHGALYEVDGVRFQMKKREIGEIEKMGLIPMVAEFGQVIPFSAKTLFNGDNIGLQTYSVVRVFDYVTKVLIDFLNRRAFENFNVNTRMDIQKQITKFLDSVTGPGKLIEKFKVLRFEQDPKKKDRIFLDIYLVPYFPAKTFLIKLDGQKGDDPDSADWQADYLQQ
jgi:Type VI secretion system, TssC, VipB